MVKKQLFGFLLIIISFIGIENGNAQSDDDFFIRDDTVADFVGINQYDVFCPILEGDSIRYCNKTPCTGWIRDYYPGTEKLIHEGGYEFGHIANSFTNYFYSGKIERSFVKRANGDYYSLQVFDSLSNPISEIEYYRTTIIKRKDYYRGGILELEEIYDKKGRYFVSQKYFYPNGVMFSELMLIDKKKNVYSYKEFSKTGNIKLQGQKVRNPEVNDYFNHQKWTYYDETGKIIRVENYIKGMLSD
jgi:antitoxin component YwqK of YwqJK toxin-antitoxin module